MNSKHSRAARRYARALFDLASEQQRLDAVSTDLVNLRALMGTSDAFARLVQDPTLGRDRRLAALHELLEKRAEPLALRLLDLLVDRRRLGLLTSIVEAFEQFMDAKLGRVHARVVSALPRAEQQLRAIEQRLSARLGRQVIATAGVEPALLGGFKVYAGGRVYDYSVASQIESARLQMINA
jgi:F-type H+-transporting ATPase subunit delta